MKNIGTLYQDDKGNVWLIKKESLPKKKGDYTFWTGALLNDYDVSHKEYRDDTKGALLSKIKNTQQ